MLNEAIVTYEKLLNYTFILKFKKIDAKKEHTIEIAFLQENFFHLIGLEYLTDIKMFLRGSKSSVYRRIVKQERLRNRIMNSQYFSEISERVNNIANLQNILNKMTKIHYYVRPYWTDIEADYVIQNVDHNKKSYLFIKCKEDGYYIGCSTIKDQRNFITGNRTYTTTYKRYVPIATEDNS